MAKHQLYTKTGSPFSRKVLIFASELGIRDQIEVINQEIDPIKGAKSELIKANPLAKAPALVKPDGSSIFDSSVIVQYLDSLVGPEKRLLPPINDPKRYDVLTIEALCDGILDATVLKRIEYTRLEAHQHPGWIAGQSKKMELGVKRLFTLKLESVKEKVSYEAICTATVLWYLDLYFKDWPWWEYEGGGKELKLWYDEVNDTKKEAWDRDELP